MGILELKDGNITSIISIVIGLFLQTLSWFPDNIDKYWPWDFRTFKGVRYFLYLELIVIVIFTFVFPLIGIEYFHF